MLLTHHGVWTSSTEQVLNKYLAVYLTGAINNERCVKHGQVLKPSPQIFV